MHISVKFRYYKYLLHMSYLSPPFYLDGECLDLIDLVKPPVWAMGMLKTQPTGSTLQCIFEIRGEVCILTWDRTHPNMNGKRPLYYPLTKAQ